MTSTPPARHGPRCEWKALLSPAEAEAVVAWARPRMAADPFAGAGARYEVESVYFDTGRLLCARGGATQLPKYRIRRYDGGDCIWFVEEKMRRGDDVYKRRAAGTPAQIAEVVAAPRSGGGHREWFRRRFAVLALRPTLWLRYVRLALQAEGVRFTVDRDLACAATTRLSFTAADRAALETDHVLEVKFAGAPSALARELMRRAGDAGRRYSKYVAGMAALGALDLAEPRP